MTTYVIPFVGGPLDGGSCTLPKLPANGARSVHGRHCYEFCETSSGQRVLIYKRVHVLTAEIRGQTYCWTYFDHLDLCRDVGRKVTTCDDFTWHDAAAVTKAARLGEHHPALPLTVNAGNRKIMVSW